MHCFCQQTIVAYATKFANQYTNFKSVDNSSSLSQRNKQLLQRLWNVDREAIYGGSYKKMITFVTDLSDVICYFCHQKFYQFLCCHINEKLEVGG